MIRAEALTKKHLARLRPQAAHRAELGKNWRWRNLAMARQGLAWALMDGRMVVAVAGLREVPAMGGAITVGWAILGREAKTRLLALTRAFAWRLARERGPVVITVRPDFEPGKRWARMLGFAMTAMTAPDGQLIYLKGGA